MTQTPAPPVPAGDVAVICVGELTVKLVAGGAGKQDSGCAGEVGTSDDDAGATSRRP